MPVAANVAVALVDVANTLGVNDIHDLADLAVVNDLLERAEEGSVAENVADDNVNALLVSGIRDLVALLGSGSGGLFEKEMITELDRLHSGLEVHLILRSDDRRIGKLGQSENILPALKASAVVKLAQLFDVISSFGIGISDADELKLGASLKAVLCISSASAAETDDDNFKFLHFIPLVKFIRQNLLNYTILFRELQGILEK